MSQEMNSKLKEESNKKVKKKLWESHDKDMTN